MRGATVSLRDATLQRLMDTAQTAVRILCSEAPREEGRHELSSVEEHLRTPLLALSAALKALLEGVAGISEASAEVEKLHEQLYSVIERLSHLTSDESWDGLRWIDVNPRSIRLNLTPLDVADTLNGMFNADHQAWIFTSATLAVGDDFGHFTGRMGLADATGLTFPSPYALADKGLVWLPPGLPMPADREHTAEMLNILMPLLEMTAGGMFCLFTSHRALGNARRWFKSRRARLGGRKLLIQGDAPRDDLLRRFRQYGDAVLLGTAVSGKGSTCGAAH